MLKCFNEELQADIFSFKSTSNEKENVKIITKTINVSTVAIIHYFSEWASF